MIFFQDYQGNSVRLTDERLAHILERREMQGMEKNIERTLLEPQHVVQSYSDANARLYYRFFYGTIVGDKYLCVVVKIDANDAYVLTAYLTDRVKKGLLLWPIEE